MNRIDRLFGILTLLQSRKYVTAEKIAENFGMSVRTVYRDIKALCEQGIPVSFEPHRGYFIVKGYFLPPVSFTQDEANALLLMETLVQGFADKSTGTHYATAFNKMKSVMNFPQKEALENMHSNIRLQIPDCLSNNFAYLSVLQQAIADRHCISIDYSNSQAVTSQRCVEPIGLIFYAFNWHLIGWCRLRKDYRDFRLSRIINVRSLHQSFEQDNHMSLNDYMKLLPVPY